MELQKTNSNKPGHPIEPPKIEISTKKYNFYQNILENSKIPIKKNILEKQDNVELLTKLRKKEDEKLSALQIPVFGCSPDIFPELMAAAIRKKDISKFLTKHNITLK